MMARGGELNLTAKKSNTQVKGSYVVGNALLQSTASRKNPVLEDLESYDHGVDWLTGRGEKISSSPFPITWCLNYV